MSSVLGTEKEMPRQAALASRTSMRFRKRRRFPRYESEATVRAKSCSRRSSALEES